MLFVNTTRLY